MISGSVWGTSLGAAKVIAGTVLLLTTLPAPAEAQSRRPDARTMTCAKVQALIEQRGAVVLNTGPHTFDRYVSGAQQCDITSEYARGTNIATKDTKKCTVRVCARVRKNNND